MLIKKNYTFRNFDIKNIFELMRDNMRTVGYTNEAAKFICENYRILEPKYFEIASKIVTQESLNNSTEYNNYRAEENQIVLKYADRDSYGNIIYENEERKIPKISDMIVEFQKEMEELHNKYKGLMEILKNPAAYNDSIYKTEIEIELYTWENEESIPDNVPPLVHYYFV